MLDTEKFTWTTRQHRCMRHRRRLLLVWISWTYCHCHKLLASKFISYWLALGNCISSHRGFTFTLCGCCGLCFWHKPAKLAHSFLFSSCVSFCYNGPVDCISFYKFSRQLSTFSLCSSGFISALLVLSTIGLFVSLLQPWNNPLWLTGLTDQVTNCISAADKLSRPTTLFIPRLSRSSQWPTTEGWREAGTEERIVNGWMDGWMNEW